MQNIYPQYQSLHQRLGLRELNGLLKRLPAVVCCRRIDEQLSFSYLSPAMHQISGYTADELTDVLGRSFESLLHPQEKLTKLRRSLLEQLEHSSRYTLQYRIFRRDGRSIWIWESGCQYAGGSDHSSYLEAVLIDVSDWHQQLQVLEKSLVELSRQRAQIGQQLMDAESRARHSAGQMERLEKRIHRQGMALGQFVFGCADIKTTPALADYICEQLTCSLQVTHCSVWRFSQSRQTMSLITEAKASDKQLLRHQYGRLFTAIDAGIPFTISGDREAVEYRRFLDDFNVTGVMVIPLQLHQQSFGALLVEQRDMPRYWQADEVNFAISVALIMMSRIVEIEAEEIRSRLHTLAYFDSLTELENRLLFQEQLKGALSRLSRGGQPLALFFIDLNSFKQVNDSFGHVLGDKLLKEVAVRLRSTFRKTDHLARLGGDEFAVLSHSIGDQLAVAQLAEKLCKAISAPYMIGGFKVQIGASIGIALAPKNGQSAESLMHMADQAMYRAKNMGGSQYQFVDQLATENTHEELVLLNELRNALDEKQLELVYLPQISLKDGHICGAEALLRWRHPRLGLLAPIRFIGLAERNNLLKSIGDWVCEQVIADAAQLTSDARPIVFSFNLSSSQMDDAGLVERLAKRLKAYSLAPSRLRIELKEDSLNDHQPAKERLLNQLHRLGIGLTIDNFGAGAFDLEALSRMPIDLLKLDQHLMRDIEYDEGKKGLVTTMFALAAMLGKQMVAEGIETQHQAEFLADHQCDFAQGFYYFRPMAFDAFSKVLH